MNTKNSSHQFDSLSKEVVDCCYKIHQYFGAGLLESIYEDALCEEFLKINIEFEKQKRFSVFYEEKELKSKFIADFIVDNKIILELKSVEKIIPSHKAQILTYLKISKLELGFIVNFGDPYFKRGIERFIMDSS